MDELANCVYSHGFCSKVAPLLTMCLSEERMMYHYLSIARGHLAKYLSGDMVQPKKYFYALRPILACRWLQKYHTAPPVLFDKLVKACLPSELKSSVANLLSIKMMSSELAEIAPIMDIHTYLEESIPKIETYLNKQTITHKVDWQTLNTFFLQEIGMSENNK